ELIDASRRLVVKADPFNTEGRKRVKLVRLRDPVMVHILPETQRRVHAVSGADPSITITAIGRLVVLGESKKAILPLTVRRSRLWGAVTKELTPVVHLAVAIPIQSQPCVVRSSLCPGSPEHGFIGWAQRK